MPLVLCSTSSLSQQVDEWTFNNTLLLTVVYLYTYITESSELLSNLSAASETLLKRFLELHYYLLPRNNANSSNLYDTCIVDENQ